MSKYEIKEESVTGHGCCFFFFTIVDTTFNNLSEDGYIVCETLEREQAELVLKALQLLEKQKK